MALVRTQKATLVGDTGGSPATTGSFTPSANSLLVCKLTAIGFSVYPTFTVSGGSLTWTKQVDTNSPGNNQTVSQIWTAPVGGSPSSMTVQASYTGNIITDGNDLIALEIEEYTGYDTGTPTGLSGIDVVSDATPHSGNLHMSLGGTTAATSIVTACLFSDGDGGDPQINADTGWTNSLQSITIASGGWACVANIYHAAGSTVSTADWATWTRNWGHAAAALEIRAAGGAADVSETIVSIEAGELDPDAYDEGVALDQAIQPIFAAVDEIVALDAEQEIIEEPGLDLWQDRIVDPSTAIDVSETIVALDAVELDPAEYDEALWLDAAIQPVFASVVEIVSLDSEELDPPIYDEGLWDDADIQPVFAATVEIVCLEAEQEIVEEPGLDYWQDRIVDPSTAVDVSETIANVEAVEIDPPDYDEGLFLDQAIQPLFADTVEIIALDTEELDPNVYDEGHFLDQAIQPLFADVVEVVVLEGEQEIIEEPGLELWQDRIVDAVTIPDVSETIATIEAVELDAPEYDEGLWLDQAIAAVFADQAEIVAVDGEQPPDDEPGLEIVQDGALQPVFAETVEIVSLDAEQEIIEEAGLDYVEVTSPALAPDGSELIVWLEAASEPADDVHQPSLDLVQDGTLTMGGAGPPPPPPHQEPAALLI